MNRPRRPSPLLLGLCAGVMLGTGWAVVRVRPAARDLVGLQQRRGELEQSLASSPVPVDLTSLEEEVAALRAERDALVARNAERAARVAPPDEVPELEHRVATLARDAGLRLEAQDVVPSPGGDAPRASRWTLSGGFAGLWRFIASLEGLPRRVVLRDLHVTRVEAVATERLAPRRPEPPLRIQLTVTP